MMLRDGVRDVLQEDPVGAWVASAGESVAPDFIFSC